MSPGGDLLEHTARFCRLLRAEGLPVAPAATVEAARVLELVDLGDREDLRLGFRSVLVPPSPKSHRTATTWPSESFDWSVNVTGSGAVPALGCARKAAVGGLLAMASTPAVAGLDAAPALSVLTTAAVYFPANA